MPFAPGQSGNPGGRKKEKPFLNALNMEIAKAGEDHKALRVIAAKVLELAQGGDMQAVTFVADRLDGKPVQAIEGDTTVRADDTITALLTRIAQNGRSLVDNGSDV